MEAWTKLRMDSNINNILQNKFSYNLPLGVIAKNWKWCVWRHASWFGCVLMPTRASPTCARAVALPSANMADEELTEQGPRVEILQNGDSHQLKDETDPAEDVSKKKKKKKKKAKAAIIGKETVVVITSRVQRSCSLTSQPLSVVLLACYFQIHC